MPSAGLMVCASPALRYSLNRRTSPLLLFGDRFPLRATLRFVLLNTGYRGPRHVKLHLAGDLQLDDVIPKTADCAVYPAAGHHPIASFQVGQHRLRLASLNLLRSDKQKVEDTKDQHKRKQLSEGSAQEEVSHQKDSLGFSGFRYAACRSRPRTRL